MKTFKTHLNESLAGAVVKAATTGVKVAKGAGKAAKAAKGAGKGAKAASEQGVSKTLLAALGGAILHDIGSEIITGIVNKISANMRRPGGGIGLDGAGGAAGNRLFTSSLYNNPIKITDDPNRLVHNVEI